VTLPVAEIISWDVANWSHCLSYWQPWVEPLDRTSSRVLVLGERSGGISLWFALLGFDVICSDYRLPGDDVRQFHQRWLVQERVTYAAVDMFSIPFPDNHFDVVACKSVIGGLKVDYKDPSTRSLQGQQMAVEEVRRVLRPGGIFLGAENLVGTGLHAGARHLRYKGRVGWRHLRLSEVRWLFGNYSVCEQLPWGFLGTHWPSRLLNRMTALMDRYVSRWLPADSLYISFIRARK